MRQFGKGVFLAFLIVLFALSLSIKADNTWITASRQQAPVSFGGKTLDAYYFYGQGCPHCEKVAPFLDEMNQKYPLNLHKFDIYTNNTYISIFDSYAAKHGISDSKLGIPAVFVNDIYLIGDSPILGGFEDAVRNELSQSPTQAVDANSTQLGLSDSSSRCSDINGDQLSLLAITVAAFVDSINPCAFGVLIFLIGARIFVAEQHKRALKLGLSFCVAVFITYIMFGLGLLSILNLAGFSGTFSVLVGLATLLIGVLYLKDAFWHRKGGFALEVPNGLKPVLMRMLKAVANPFGAFALGFVSAVFELPCSGGPYLCILGRLANNTTRFQTIPLLAYYNLIYVLPLVAISLLLYSNFLSVGRLRDWNEKNKGLLKFFGGILMLYMGLSVVIQVPPVLQASLLFLSFFRIVGPLVLVPACLFALARSPRIVCAFKLAVRSSGPVLLTAVLVLPLLCTPLRSNINSLSGLSNYDGTSTSSLQEAQQQPAQSQEQLSRAKQTASIPKRDRPEVHAFIMSYCPYGLQFLKAYVPVMKLLGEKVAFELNFVPHIMHGEKELTENVRMYCIQKEERSKLASYLGCFVESGDAQECMKTALIDTGKIDVCMQDVDQAFGLTTEFKDSNRYPRFDIDAGIAEKYAVQGSPTVVINGKMVEVVRSAEGIGKTVCSAFTFPPEECKMKLGIQSEKPGFGIIGLNTAGIAEPTDIDCTGKPDGTDCGTCCKCSSGNRTYDETQDSDCPVYDCSPLDTTCRDYNDVQYCKALDECADANEDCNSYFNMDTTTVCNWAWKCSDSIGNDNKYDAYDYKKPSLGYCDGLGNCDWGVTGGTICTLAEGTAEEGTGKTICVDGYSSCRNSCSDGLDNDEDGCTDSVDSNCGGTDTTCNNYDDDCDGTKDEDYVSVACGDSECDGITSCVSGQVNCSSWNTECDTEKCCQCNGGTQAYPIQDYDETQDEDCPSSYCVALDVCYVDVSAPTVTILSPQNTIYYSSVVHLTFAVNEPVSWRGFSLDNQPNVTITGNTMISVEDGAHHIIIYANDTSGNMGSSQIIYFTVNSSLYHPWKTSFIGLGNYPIVDLAVYNGNLYAASDNRFYAYDQSSWNVIDAPTFVTSLEPYGDTLVVGGHSGLYCYDGTSFSLVFSVPTYIKALGVYNNTLCAGTMLDNPPKLYYCNGSADNPANWHVDTDFSDVLNFTGPFGSIDSFVEYNGILYITSGDTVYSFNGTDWNTVSVFDDVYAFLDMQIYDGKLYLATRDQGWRKPLYQGGTGFSGRVIEFDGENWTTVLDHGYWVYSLGVYDGKLYAGTANKILTYNGTSWETSFNATEGAYYAISMITYDGKVYAGMGNGYIFADPAPDKANPETIVVPEFSSNMILAVFMALTMLAAALTRKHRSRRFS